MREPRFIPAFSFMLAGFIIWAAHFLFIYGVTGLLCARPQWASAQILQFSLEHAVVGLSTVLALTAVGWVFLRAAGNTRHAFAQMTSRFYVGLTCSVAALAAVAIVWQGFFTLAAPGC